MSDMCPVSTGPNPQADGPEPNPTAMHYHLSPQQINLLAPRFPLPLRWGKRGTCATGFGGIKWGATFKALIIRQEYNRCSMRYCAIYHHMHLLKLHNPGGAVTGVHLQRRNKQSVTYRLTQSVRTRDRTLNRYLCSKTTTICQTDAQ